MLKVATDTQVGMALVDMCMYGLRMEDGDIEGLARKRARLMTNSHKVFKKVETHCTNDHEHVPLCRGERSSARSTRAPSVARSARASQLRSAYEHWG